MWLRILSNRFISLYKRDHYFSVSRRTSLDFSLIMISNLVNNGTNFVANIIIARMFGHEIFGVFSIAVNIANTVSYFPELGMSLTMVRLYKLYENDVKKSQAVLLWNFYFKCIMFTIVVLIGIICGKTLSVVLIQREDKAFLIAIALICGGTFGFLGYLKSLLQAFNLFKNIAYLTFFYAFLRMFFLVLSFLFFQSVEFLFLSIYLAPLFLLLIIGLYTQRDKFHFSTVTIKQLREAGKSIVGYSKWVGVSAVAFILVEKSMFFITTLYTDLKQISLLSAGLVFTAIFSLTNDSVRQILFPKIAQLEIDKLKQYKTKIVKWIPLYFFGCLCIIAILSIFINISLGEKYQESISIFWISSIGIAFTSGLGFYNILFHTLMKPKLDTFINVGTLIVSIIINLLIVKKYGIIGVVSTYAAILSCGEIVKAVLLSRCLNKVYTQTYQ